MKKNSIYALMSAIALAGAVGFCGCSSSSDEIIDNPDYNPETNSVKTSITLSINPANTSAGTRQTNAIVQNAATDFRGITGMYLVPANGAITGTTTMTKKLNLGDFATTDYVSSGDNQKNYKTYANQDVAVGVSHFLFLGKAIPSTVSDAAGKLANGYTTNTFADDISESSPTVADLKVTAGTILSSTDTWTTQTNALATYLLTVANATGWATSTNASLRNMHTLFCRTSQTAGSANAVLLTLQNLYRKIDGITDDATTVTNIRNAILAANTAEIKSGSGSSVVLGWADNCTFKDFPTSLGLPDGAAHYKYVAADGETAAKFEYTAASSTENVASTAATDFIYPNELYYLTNTPIKTTATKTVTWPTTTTAWATADNWATATWTGTAVAGDTKNIALEYNIQYGTARLATQVKCAATTLYDNAKALDTDLPATNKAINVSENSFKLTGVIVGGQPSQVGWNYLPTSTTGFTKALYDRVDNIDVSSTSAYSTPNYTLVFDNYYSDSEAKDVSICLEFLNNSGSDFYGKDGLILNGQKFYLVGKLTMTGTTNPLASVGEDATLKAFVPSRAARAFIQDYTTTAQFIITAGTDTATGENVGSLGKALSTVPDLRTSAQEIGLSVDLTWQAGLTFPDIVLGQ